MVIWVAEKCWWLVCNNITFIHLSVFVVIIEIVYIPKRPDLQHVAVCFYPQCPAQKNNRLFNTHLCLFLSN